MSGRRRIIRDRRVREGAPTLEGTQITVGDLIQELARGTSVDGLRHVFPLLEREDIESALALGARQLGALAPSMPKLGVIVVVHDMPTQAERTLRSLGPSYQQGVRAEDYEIIVVENHSPRMLGERAATRCAPNIRYFARQELVRSPVGAANYGACMARAQNIALCIDGARMFTPGVVRSSIDALALGDDVVVAVPGYHLGAELQQEAVETGHDCEKDTHLLESIGWPAQGYRLFDIACPSGSCRGGPLRPMAESNFLALPAVRFLDLGGYDPGFDDFGGGYCNLDMYVRLVEDPKTRLVVLPGEGSFHQFHGGVTTGGVRGHEREVLMSQALAQYERIRQRPWRLPSATGEVFGFVPAGARRFLGPQASEPTTERRRPVVRAGDTDRKTA